MNPPVTPAPLPDCCGAPAGAADVPDAKASPAAGPEAPLQRIIKIRRDYNSWVASETMEDYALRFTPQRFRKWSE